MTTVVPKKRLPAVGPYHKNTESIIINHLMRDVNLVKDSKHDRLIDFLPNTACKAVSEGLDTSHSIVQEVSDKFLVQAKGFVKFLKGCQIKWTHTPSKLFTKARIYLHKLHKLAPVFDYKRARINLRTLHKFFEIEGFWPKISTQLAIIVFITDLYDKTNTYNKRLKQKNLRVICDCSAYAFHKSRNKMKVRRIIC